MLCLVLRWSWKSYSSNERMECARISRQYKTPNYRSQSEGYCSFSSTMVEYSDSRALFEMGTPAKNFLSYITPLCVLDVERR